jgi:CHAT domain-containing protein/tetratricopeptide (TPR) repeat protein
MKAFAMSPSGAPRLRWIRPAIVAALGAVLSTHAPERSAESIETMVREAEDLAHVEAFRPARAKLEAALRIAERRSDRRLMALCLDRIGSVLDFEGHPGGTAFHERALALARQSADSSLAASITASMGLGHWRRSEYASALQVLYDALATQEAIGDERGRARTLGFIGRVHFKKAEYAEAKQYYRRALVVAERSADRRALSITLEDLGDAELEQGFFARALAAYEHALAARRQMRDTVGEAYVLHLIGRGYLLQGAYREALVWFDQALALSQAGADSAGQALALYHAGIAHQRLAEPVVALERYADALALKEELGDRRQQAWILARMGDTHAQRQDLEPALDRYRRAMRIWEEIDDPRGMATGLEKAAGVELALGRPDAALVSYRRAVDLLTTAQPAFVASAAAGIGEAYAAMGWGTLALERGRAAVRLARRGRNDVVWWAAARSLGRIERRLGRRADALASYRESLGVIEGLRGRLVASPDVRAGFLEEKQAVYAETVELLVDMRRFEEALQVAEQARARAFLDLLSGRELVARSAWAAAATSGFSDGGSATLLTTQALTVGAARVEARRTGATIVEYFSAAERLFIWVVAPDGRVRARSSPVSRRDLVQLVRAVRVAVGADFEPGASAAGQDASNAGGRSASDVRRLLRRTHAVLVEPVEDLLPKSRDRLLMIVPHGPLFLLSFAALVDREGVYLVERHTIAYSPSISVLRYTGLNRARVAHRGAPRLLAIGNPTMPEPKGGGRPFAPLPDAEVEARAIAALYPPEHASALIGPRARERIVRDLAPAQTIVHLATHAVVVDNDPMSSYLALAADTPPSGLVGTSDHDGILTVAEVFGLDLRTDLITLSACSTGLGQINGDGVVGLSRAFIYAGAASVLVSLWRVADSLLVASMERFYREMIRTGGNKAAALAAAQREMIAALRRGSIKTPFGSPLSENPLLWAPFVLVGEPR